MTGLANLQALFQNHVVGGDDAAAVFVGDRTASAEERLCVYFDAYRLRLIENLRIDFPGLRALMSAEAFDAICLRYIDQHPSRGPNIRWFGRHLAGFLAADRELAGQPVLVEMARFEWARGLAFDAPDSDVLTADAPTRTMSGSSRNAALRAPLNPRVWR